MSQNYSNKTINRRDFLKIAGGVLAAAAGALTLPNLFRRQMGPIKAVEAAADDPFDLYFGGTDGWAAMPPSSPGIPPFFSRTTWHPRHITLTSLASET